VLWRLWVSTIEVWVQVARITSSCSAWTRGRWSGRASRRGFLAGRASVTRNGPLRPPLDPPAWCKFFTMKRGAGGGPPEFRDQWPPSQRLPRAKLPRFSRPKASMLRFRHPKTANCAWCTPGGMTRRLGPSNGSSLAVLFADGVDTSAITQRFDIRRPHLGARTPFCPMLHRWGGPI
jgi:hypothetical protein